MRGLLWQSMLMLTALAVLPAFAAPTPVGRWTTFDDDTGKPAAIVEIVETRAELSGRIVQIFVEPGEDPDPRCKACTGERKDQPVKGMVILWGFAKRADGGSNTDYADGHILDPDNGKIYRSQIRLSEDGNVLNVRGYVGFSVFGRTQVWKRVKPDAGQAGR